MKLVVFALIFALCLSITSSTKVPAQEVIDTIEGILVGAFGEVGKEARDCLNDGEESFKHIGSAIQYFKNGTVVSIIYGISEIGKALELLPNELKDCKNLPELVKDFEKIAAEFKDPKNLTIHVGKEILFNGKSIYNDITNCIKNFETEKFEPAGENIGDIVYILFIKDDIVRGRLEATQFVEGFFNFKI